MKKLIIILVTIAAFLGCKEETKYEMELVLSNSTENSITVELFPNSEYVHNDMYRFSDTGKGHRPSKFTIRSADNRRELFVSENIHQQPYDLLSNVFDSIHITLNDDSQHIIKFSKDAVIGYSENIFTENSIWNYKVINDTRPTQLASNPIKVHQFTFEISVDKLIK